MTGMFIRLDRNGIAHFPYTREQFRRDNPNVSFPKDIPVGILRRHAVYPVEQLPSPAYDPLVERLVRDELPHRQVIRIRTEEDATNPVTGEVDQEQIGKPIYGNKWFVGYTVERFPQEEAEANVRRKRDHLLDESDWVVIRARELGQDVPRDWFDYRGDLRQIPEQEGFPYAVVWPTKPKE